MKRLCRIGLVAMLFSSCVCSSPAPEITKKKSTAKAVAADPEETATAKPEITVEKLRTAIDLSNTPERQAAVEAEALGRITVEEDFASVASNRIHERTNLNAELDRLQEAIESGAPPAASEQ